MENCTSFSPHRRSGRAIDISSAKMCIKSECTEHTLAVINVKEMIAEIIDSVVSESTSHQSVVQLFKNGETFSSNNSEDSCVCGTSREQKTHAVFHSPSKVDLLRM